MENNDTIMPEENQQENETKKQTSSSEGVETGKKILKDTAEVAKSGAKVVGSVTSASSGIFAFIAGNIKVIMIAMAIAATAAAVGAAVKAIIDADKIKIMDTATVVTEIKKISELTTYTYIDELIVHEKKVEAKESKGGLFGILKKEDTPDSLRSEIVMIVSGVTRAGYDLGKLTGSDIKISGDTISVNLPAAEIFDVIVNPSDARKFVEEGKWSHEETTAMQVNCRNQMHQNALDRGIIKKANEVGKEKVENLFRALGFKVVKIVAQED